MCLLIISHQDAELNVKIQFPVLQNFFFDPLMLLHSFKLHFQMEYLEGWLNWFP